MSNTPPTPEARPNTYLPEGLAIRARVPGDAAEIAAMHNMPGYRYGTLRLPHHTPDEVRKAIENPPSGYINLVAMLDGRIVGDIGLNRFPAAARMWAASAWACTTTFSVAASAGH